MLKATTRLSTRRLQHTILGNSSPFDGRLRRGPVSRRDGAAHPRKDPATGELHALCYEATDLKRICYNVVDIAGRVSRSVLIPVSHGPLIHDCAITERYVIVMDLPLTLSMRVVLSGNGFPYRWNKKHPARIGLLPRDCDADSIRWISLDPCFVFHTANAFDLPDGRVALDVIAYDRMVAGDNLAPDEQPRGLERWTIDPAPQEFPTIDGRRTGLPYRYAYALGLPEELSETLVGESPLLKHDLERGTRHVHDFGPGHVAGEFVFVPRAQGTAEDAHRPRWPEHRALGSACDDHAVDRHVERGERALLCE